MCGADAVSGADTDAANLIGSCTNSKRIRTRIGQEIPRSVVSICGFFPNFNKWRNVSAGR